MTTPLNLYFSVSKMIKFSLIAIFMVLIGVKCFTADIYNLKIVGLLQMVLGLSTFFVFLKSAVDRNPKVIMDEKGIIDHRILKTMISWNQIQKLEVLTKNDQKFLKLIVSTTFKDENFKWLYRPSSKMKLKEKPKSILINLDQLKINYDVLNEFLSAKDTNYEPKNLDKNLTGFGNFIDRILS